MIPGRYSCAFGLRALTFSPRPHLLVQVGTRPSSSLSAVHRGLRRSERLDRRGHSPYRGDARPSTKGRPRAAVEGDPSEKIDFKIRKGKKDIAEPSKPKRPSRSARFNDPTDPFGKKSLVYKLKTGQLRDELSALQTKDAKAAQAQTEDDFWGTAKPPPTSRSRSAPPRRGKPKSSPSTPPWGGRGRKNPHHLRFESSLKSDFRRSERSASEGARRPDMEGRNYRTRDSKGARSREYGEAPPNRNTEAPRSGDYGAPRSRDAEDPRSGYNETPRSRDYGAPHRPDVEAPRSQEYGAPPSRDVETPRNRHMDAPRNRDSEAPRSREYGAPRSRSAERYSTQDYGELGDRPEPAVAAIKYTTAASQFLYGAFVVEEALRASRRKLYHLYIYGGANRENVGRDKVIEKLAAERGVKVTTLGEHDQKLMSKMSQGRPHNGYILEASPLPQPPVIALGPLATEKSESGGVDSNSFGIVLGHQTAEDSAINGKDTVVQARSGQHKPLVLLLDHVLDPGNLGAILRTASFLGASAVAISTKNSATLTPVALKASAGASETIPLFAVDSPVSFLEGSREAGWKVYAAVASHSGSHHREHTDIYGVEESDPLASDPCILVVGSEGEGLPRMLKAKADIEISIPNQSGSLTVDSLNVSVAAALLCSAFMRGPNLSAMPRRRGGPAKSHELGIWEA
ncbi:hypothetical protein MAPG_07540 [Magnaporthiopsis poae ATCC 64411]|uniref:rRNA methyltransferase 1, mitochondrial n=1 Tax=Magnaporthiopsis poae (strain ATCC 64411 / 73-15) TaxID=644358 RepID=A0A0C4E4Y4_MAGP6|nr:hypothetical protein MAPG_07540 [Magnaporthiopsis poae ATCC 64411]